jgi:PAS domain S-box-containing protein
MDVGTAGPVRVLHVDDEPDFADTTAAFLEAEDDRFSVEAATSATEAMERLDDGVDCVVSDYEMPGRNGIEFLETVRAEYPDLPFILFTGKGSEEIASEAVSAGVTDYLQKGVGTEKYTVLANRIANAVDQYRSRAALETSQKRLSLFIEQSPLGVVEWDDAFEVVRLNDAATEILGYEEADLRGRSWEAIVPESDRDAVDDVVNELLAAEGGYHSVNENVRKDGTRVVCEWHNRVVTDGDGDTVAIFSQFQDVTDRHEREGALRETKRRLGMALEATDTGVWEWDLETDAVTWNETLEHVMGLDPGEFEGTFEAFVDRVHPDDIRRVERKVERAVETDSNYEAEFRMVRDDGEVRWVAVRGQILDEDGTRRMVGVHQDITDRKTRERKVTALHDVATDLDVSGSAEYICRQCVEASREILEFDLSVVDLVSDGYLTKAAVSEDVPSENAQRMSVDEGIAGKTYRTGESMLVDDIGAHEAAKPQGPYRSVISVPVGDHGVFQAVAEDAAAFDERDLELAELLVSHLESALDRFEHESRLERQNERLEQFASVVSHDLRSPLAVARGQLELARAERDGDRLETVARAHDRMAVLIDDLLTLAREDEEVGALEPVALGDLVTECRRTVETDGATVESVADTTVRADRGRLRQLLENLIGNAVEHGGPGVTVTVGDLPSGDGFYVEDDGEGIPADERADVFELGYSTAEDGTGVGLRIVEQVAEAHGWTVTVTEGADGGVRVEVDGVTVDPE